MKCKFVQYKFPLITNNSITIWKFCDVGQGFTPAANPVQTNGGSKPPPYDFFLILYFCEFAGFISYRKQIFLAFDKRMPARTANSIFNLVYILTHRTFKMCVFFSRQNNNAFCTVEVENGISDLVETVWLLLICVCTVNLFMKLFSVRCHNGQVYSVNKIIIFTTDTRISSFYGSFLYPTYVCFIGSLMRKACNQKRQRRI